MRARTPRVDELSDVIPVRNRVCNILLSDGSESDEISASSQVSLFIQVRMSTSRILFDGMLTSRIMFDE